MNRFTTWTAAAAMVAGSLALATPVHAAPTKAGSYVVTAKINKTVAIGKETVLKVRGRVTPKATGEKVILQQRVGNKKKWTATDDAKIKANGTYVLSDKPSTPGTRQYRVLKPGSGGIGKGFSKTLSVDVYRWEKLAYRVTGPRVNLNTVAVQIGAETYSPSLATAQAGTPASVEYTLGRKCTSMRATYALTDESATGASGTVQVSADGKVLASHQLTVGAVFADEVVDLTGVFRLKLDLSATVPAGAPANAAVTAVGKPEVLCTR